VSQVPRNFESAVSLACADTGDLALTADSRYNLISPDGPVSEEFPAPRMRGNLSLRFSGTDPDGRLLLISSEGVEGCIHLGRANIGIACDRLAIRGTIKDEEIAAAVARVCASSDRR
jgi:hypothetical protein